MQADSLPTELSGNPDTERLLKKLKGKLKKKILERNDNEHVATQNLWDVAKPVFRGKYTAIQSSL